MYVQFKILPPRKSILKKSDRFSEWSKIFRSANLKKMYVYLMVV